MDTATELTGLAELNTKLIGNTGILGQPLANDQGAPLEPPLFVRRPWLDPPSGFFPFDEQNGIALPAVGAGDTVVLTFVVPEGYDGVINKISNTYTAGGFVGFSGDIIWRIVANGKPIPNFQNIRNEKGTTQQPREISPIRIYSGQVIQYIVNHAANIGLVGNTICSLTGYYYPNRGA